MTKTLAVCDYDAVRRIDEDPTGLLNEGFRYRDLETGVFLTADPAGFVDGPNLYTYVKQNPWTSFDPEGLREMHETEDGPKTKEEMQARQDRAEKKQFVESLPKPDLKKGAQEIAKVAADIAVSFIPGGNLYQSGKTLSDSNASGFQKTMAGIALIPEVGVVGKLLKGLGKEASIGAKSAQTVLKDTTEEVATGLSVGDAPQRIQGPWTQRDLARAAEGKGPLDFVPTTNKAGKEVPLELHHADQMPGSAVHEVEPFHSNIPGAHPNKFNQGVTPQMRAEDASLHWQMRG